MLEILEFIFASFWRFAGTIILLSFVVVPLSTFRLVSVSIAHSAGKSE